MKPTMHFMEQIWWADTRVNRWFNRPRQKEFMEPGAGEGWNPYSLVAMWNLQ